MDLKQSGEKGKYKVFLKKIFEIQREIQETQIEISEKKAFGKKKIRKFEFEI